MNWEAVFGWSGAAIFVARLVPQPWKLYRSGIRVGVAWLGLVNAVISTTGWLIYGLAVGNPVLWVPSLVALVPEIVTLALLGFRPPDARQAAMALGWASAIALAFPLGGAPLLGAVIGVGVLTGVLPHVIVAVRSDRLTGVARRTWQIALVDGAVWGTYSLWSREPLTAFYGVVLVSGSIVVLWRLRVTEAAARVGGGPELAPARRSARQ